MRRYALNILRCCALGVLCWQASPGTEAAPLDVWVSKGPEPDIVCVGEETMVQFDQEFDWSDPIVKREVKKKTSLIKQDITLT